MTSKLQVRAGEVELTLESENAITVEEAKEFLNQVKDIATVLSQAPSKPASLPTTPYQASKSENASNVSGEIDLHVNSVAERLHASSAPDVTMAAAAYLQLVKGKTSFSRTELLEAMREASNYYNENMRGNLTKTLKRLTGTKLNQLANKTFSIKAPELIDMRQKLAK